MEEVRNRVYDWTLELIREGKVLQGLILMLSTWNFAYFRYHIRDFDLESFEKALRECGLDYFKNKSFEDIDFTNENIKERIVRIYRTLSSFKGVRYVGATKVMHFICPDVFIMWDGKIIKRYKAKTSPEGYVKFLLEMQEMYRIGDFQELDKNVSIARAIDIYNMKKYSMPEAFE
ncbi:hypothetical protein J4221_05805 [Candidatus Pacearchaeota archaeon]|nr:hypothetical protein [Candidatus Pacearchaeota archaeon]